MFVAKQVADLLTGGRALLGLLLVYVGLSHDKNNLWLAALIMLAAWTSDSIDGPLARRSRVQYRTWLGEHDLEVDMTVAAGLLIFMLETGYVNVWVGVIYFFLVLVTFWHWGLNRSLGMLFQAPIYGWFIWTSLQYAPIFGALLAIWISLVVVVTWPKFPKEVVPGFLAGMHILGKEDIPPNDK
jgi:cardiolipin synthase